MRKALANLSKLKLTDGQKSYSALWNEIVRLITKTESFDAIDAEDYANIARARVELRRRLAIIRALSCEVPETIPSRASR